MQRAIIIILLFLSFGLKAQVYQSMPQAGYGPVKRFLTDSVLTIPTGINSLRNITGGRDAGQIRWNTTDSGFYVYSGYQWIKINIDSVSLSNRINGKLNISDTATMLSAYMRKTDTLSLSNRINLRVKYTDTASMLSVYLRKLDTASLSNRINTKQDPITLTTTGTSGLSTFIGSTLNIPNYGGALTGYVPYSGATTDVTLGARNLTGTLLNADYSLQIKNEVGAGGASTLGYTSISSNNSGYYFYTSYSGGQKGAYFNYPVIGTTFSYNLPVRAGTIALVEDTVSLSNRINAKIGASDTVSLSNRINLKVNISDTASMLLPYLKKGDTTSLSNRINLKLNAADTASLSNRINLKLNINDTATMLSSYQSAINARVKYSDTAAMLDPYLTAAVTSVGLSMPVAFSVANSPVTSTGTLAVSAIGTAAQYIRGDGQLATLPSGASGGSSVDYYFNGGTSQGTIGGSTYYEMSKDAVIGTGVDFNRTNAQGNGLIAQFITDAGDPNRTEIPAGAWNFEMFFNASSAGGTPSYYIELLKYDGTTFTSIASGSAIPELITSGTSIDLYLTSLAVPYTTLLITDRLVIRIYVVTSGKTITLHTQNGHLCLVTTSFAGGVTSLNGLNANTQYLAVGTAGTDFAINSLTDTHTFNLPTASATKRGALSTTDWSTFNGKMNYTDTVSLSNRINTKLNSSDTASLSNRINTKGSGTVTSIVTNLGLTGGTITTSGTLSVDTASASILSRQRAANTYYLASNPNGYTSNTGTVTSVATGLGLSGGTISTSGTLLVDTSSASILSRQRAAATYATISALNGYLPLSGGSLSGALSITSASPTALDVIGTGKFSDILTLLGSYTDLRQQSYLRFSNTGGATRWGYIQHNGTDMTFVNDITGGTFTFNKSVIFNSTLSNGTYTYTLPSATGTLALTSALSGYLPLTGGTLTGQTLVSYAMGADNGFIIQHSNLTQGISIGYNTIKTSGTSANQNLTFYSQGTGVINIVSNTQVNGTFTALSTGSFSGALNGTSATFSGQITSTVGNNGTILFNNSATTGYNLIDIINTSGRTQVIQESSVAGTTVTNSTAYASMFGSAYAKDLILFTNGANRLKLDGSTGAATFSSSVTAQQSKFWDGTQGLYIGAFSGGSGFGALYPSTVTPSGSNHAFAASSAATVINVGAGGLLDFEIGTSSKLTIASTGAATFSSDVNLNLLKSLFVYSNTYGIGTPDGSGLQIFGGSGDVIRIGHRTTGGVFTDRLSISSAGAVTINNLGTGTVTASSGVLSTVSDSSYKIADAFIQDALPSVMNLKPRYFYWKDKSGLDTTIRQLGFYAQEVNSAIGEEAANTPKENSPWGINDRSVIAMLTKAIQEQQAQIKDLQTKIQTLENK